MRAIVVVALVACSKAEPSPTAMPVDHSPATDATPAIPAIDDKAFSCFDNQCVRGRSKADCERVRADLSEELAGPDDCEMRFVAFCYDRTEPELGESCWTTLEMCELFEKTEPKTVTTRRCKARE